MVIATTRRPRSAPLALLLVSTLAALSGCAEGEAVSAPSLREARLRWEKAGVRDYDLEWTSSGSNPAHYAVTVRGGQVTDVAMVGPDGARHEVKPARPEYYGVDGLFRTIDEELRQLDADRPFDRPKGTTAVLRFDPDPTYGYPRTYRRDVVGAPMPVAIDVVRFTPVPGGASR
jgi:hypothetical protein